HSRTRRGGAPSVGCGVRDPGRRSPAHPAAPRAAAGRLAVRRLIVASLAMRFQGWRALGAGLVAGALAALAMPPLYWLPLGVVGIVAFVWLWQTAPGPQSALLRGWVWGMGHFAVGSYWIIEAFFVPPADYELLGPPIVAGLAV